MITPGALTSIWEIHGVGAYLDLPPSATNLALRADFSIKARISIDGRYRLETRYQYNHDVLVFDGTNTLAYRGVINPDGTTLGADVVLLSGPFPEHLAGYIQAAWMATYFNLGLRHQNQNYPNVFTYLNKSKYLQDLLGRELALQIVIKTVVDSDSTIIRAYLPGDATKDGTPVFISSSYKSGLLFEQISYSNSTYSDPFFRIVEITSFTPYREPTNPEDVNPIYKHYVQLQLVNLTNTVETQMPAIHGSVGVSDYSTESHTNRLSPLAYAIRKWDDIPQAQARARGVSEVAAIPPKRWLILLVLSAGLLPIILRHLLARPANTDVVCAINNNHNTKSNK
jgi:hypothetical protein